MKTRATRTLTHMHTKSHTPGQHQQRQTTDDDAWGVRDGRCATDGQADAQHCEGGRDDAGQLVQSAEWRVNVKQYWCTMAVLQMARLMHSIARAVGMMQASWYNLQNEELM